MKRARVASVILIIIVAGAVTFLCLRFGNLDYPSAGNYLAELTLVVTIIAGVAALFSLGGVFMAYRATEFASRIKDESERVRQSADEALEKMAKSEERASDAVEQAGAHVDRVSDYQQAIVQSAGAFQPSGHFLSERIKALRDDEFVSQFANESAIRTLLDKLAYVFMENADYGAQVLKLFTGSSGDVIASALFLKNVSKAVAKKLVAERLDLEKQKRSPDQDILVDLGKILGSLS